MKIFYCITKSEIGGAQTYLYALLKRAKKRGDEAVVMASGSSWLAEKALELNFNFVPNRYFKNSFNPLNLIQAVFSSRREIKKFAPDIVHTNSGGGGTFGRLAAAFLPVKKIFTAHGWSFTDGTPIIRRIISLIGENLVTPFTDKIICVSENDARLARKYLLCVKNKISVIHNGVEIQDNVEHKNDKEFLQLLFVGRLTRPKLPIVILKALSGLSESTKNKFRLRIIGEGGQKAYLENFIQKNSLSNLVSFSSLKPEEMIKAYVDADLFLLPTEWEGFPMTILEAMSAGLPVVASRVGGISEVVDDSVGKLLTPGMEAVELRSLFEEIVNNQEWLYSRGKTAQERIKQHFSASLMCDKVFDIYAKIV